MTEDKTSFTLGPNQTKWLEALESGEYKQGRGRLDAFCCLGVANDVLNLNEYCSLTLQNTYHKLGLCDQLGSFVSTVYSPGEPGESENLFNLAEMNDSARYSFQDIAQYIRNCPENVFVESK